jgi:RNA polymerase sigma-70 factor (family 1)
MSAYCKYTDLELAARLKAGDKQAFAEIYERYSGLLYVYAFKLTKEGDAAKDITQELFISLWDNRGATDFKISLASYLYTAVRYKFLKQVAHQKVKLGYAGHFLGYMQEGINSTDDYVTEKELIRQVEKLVTALPPKMARVFILSKLEFRTKKEVAEELGISEKTVRNLLSEGLKQIRPKMGLAMLSILL